MKSIQSQSSEFQNFSFDSVSYSNLVDSVNSLTNMYKSFTVRKYHFIYWALAGIACLAFGFWVLENEMRRRRVKHGINVDTPVEERKDRISELLDGVISLIVSRLHTRDAVRMSVLSRRWQHVYTFVSEVRFYCFSMSTGSLLCKNLEGEKLSELKRKFVQAVDTFLHHHSGCRITSFDLVCCFRGCISDSFRRWMNCIGRLGVERLTIRYCSLNRAESNPHVFSPDILLGASSVKHIYLMGGSFQISSHKALEDLDFTGVVFTSESVECILLNCSNLQSLKLKFCVLPSKLHIHGPDLQLKTLTLFNCSEVVKIDLSARNLTTFELYTLRMVKLMFSNVPSLQNILIDIGDRTVASYVFEKVAKDLPNLKCMYFWTDASFFEAFEIGGVNNFRHLRQLALFLDNQNKLDLLALATILDVCPLLHKLHVSMSQPSTFNGGAEKRLVRHHTQLKEVEFSGFSSTENEYNFILYIVENVVSLERLSIFLDVRYYHLNLGRWLRCSCIGNRGDFEMRQRIIRERFQGQTISKNVEILIV
ncbi:FBD-associated F-box protein At2g26860-like isoform X2 [Henckelia pumila]|uniref:FBD-associated F-box protein At2g26860-like isoform X2 n=1 Tax=Henckelia pumila TaxID=405737 RepID=UPI003C6E2945